MLDCTQPNCKRVLDVGCGQGVLARQLAMSCEEVIAIDIDLDTLTRAISATNHSEPRMFLHGDVLTHPFAESSFDMITAVASLHHLPLKPSLLRFRQLLKPGGVLVVVGLYRAHTVSDYVWSAAAFPISLFLRGVYGHATVGAPLQDPRETLRDIRTACHALLPNAEIRRRLFFRYSMIWRKPFG